MPSHVLSTYKELSILLVRLSFGLKQTKKAAREQKIVNFFPNSMEKQGAITWLCHGIFFYYKTLMHGYSARAS